MTYSTNPVAGAERHITTVDAENELREKTRESYVEHIVKTLTVVCRRDNNLELLTVPYVQWGNSSRKIAHQSVLEVICEEVAFAESRDAFAEVWANSECPIVAKLRETVAKKYCADWVDSLVEVSR
jgi:hypothetical protein